MSRAIVLAVVTDSSRVTAGPLALLTVLLMAIATGLLIRNMNRRLKKLPSSFPADEPSDVDRVPEQTG